MLEDLIQTVSLCIFVSGWPVSWTWLFIFSRSLLGILKMWSSVFFGFGFVLKGSFLSLALSLILKICSSLFRSKSSLSCSFSSFVMISYACFSYF